MSTTVTSARAGRWGNTVTGTGAGRAKSAPVSQAPVRSSARIVSAIGPAHLSAARRWRLTGVRLYSWAHVRHLLEQRRRPRPRAHPAARALALDLHGPLREPRPAERRRAEGGRPPGELGLGREHHDRALRDVSPPGRSDRRQAARLPRLPRPPVPARAPPRGRPPTLSGLRRAPGLPESDQGHRRRGLLHGLGRARRGRGDLRRARAPVPHGPFRRARGRALHRPRGRRGARRREHLGSRHRGVRAPARQRDVDRRPQPPEPRSRGAGRQGAADPRDVWGERLARHQPQVREPSEGGVRPPPRRAPAAPDRRHAERRVPGPPPPVRRRDPEAARDAAGRPDGQPPRGDARRLWRRGGARPSREPGRPRPDRAARGLRRGRGPPGQPGRGRRLHDQGLGPAVRG